MTAPNQRHQKVRNALAHLISDGMGKNPFSPTLLRYCELIRTYDTACNRDRNGCVFAVYGRRKVGKSTLFNTIMGADVLPCKPIPATGSVIDLVRVNRPDYLVACKGKGEPLIRHCETPEEVRGFLEQCAGQKSPCDSVTVSGPFPDAADFVTDKCRLRDTPGAEAYLDNMDCALDERLKEDSAKALKSMRETDCIPLFCLNAQEKEWARESNLYAECFQTRSCLHVVTRIDTDSEDLSHPDVLRRVESCRQALKLPPSETVLKPIVCTGIQPATLKQKRVNIGYGDLVREMQALIDPAKLGNTLCGVADYILQCGRQGLDWEAGCGVDLFLRELECAMKS